MATSSIKKNFVVSGKRQVEMFADAIEASMKNKTPRIKVQADFLTNQADINSLMEKRNHAKIK